MKILNNVSANQLQQCIKTRKKCSQVEFIPGMQYLKINLCNPLCKQCRKKSCMFTSISLYVEKAVGSYSSPIHCKDTAK